MSILSVPTYNSNSLFPIIISPSPSPLPFLHSPPSTPLFLAIDGGGTKTTAAICTCSAFSSQEEVEEKEEEPTLSSSPSSPNNHSATTSSSNSSSIKIISRFTSISSNYSDKGLIKAIEAIKLVLEGALKAIGFRNGIEEFKQSGKRFESIWAGLAGVDDEKGRREMKEGIEKLLGISNKEGKGKGKEVEVTNDCELLASEIQASGNENGVVLISGTGSIGLAFSSRDIKGTGTGTGTETGMKCIGRVGGHGYILGDEGSGFHTGREAIRRILQLIDEKPKVEYDRIVSESTLIPLVLQHFNVTRIEDLLSAVYTGILEPITIAEGEGDSSTSTSSEHSRKLKISSLSRLVQATAYPSSFLLPSPTNSSTPLLSPSPDPISLSILELTSNNLQSILTKLCTATKILPYESTLVLGTGLWTCEPFRELVIRGMKLKGVEWKEIRIVGVKEGGPEGVALRELVRRWRLERV